MNSLMLAAGAVLSQAAAGGGGSGIAPFLSAGGNFFNSKAADGFMYQDLSGGSATAASSSSDVVGTVLAEGSGAFTMHTDNTNNRGTVSSAETLIQFDDSDDFYFIESGTRTSDMYVAYVVNSTVSGVHFGNNTSSSQYFGNVSNGSTFDSFLNVGSPTIKANGVDLGTPNRDVLFDNTHLGTPVLVEWIGIDLTNSNFSNMKMGRRATIDSFGGGIGDVVIDVNSASVRDNIPALLAARHGITL